MSVVRRWTWMLALVLLLAGAGGLACGGEDGEEAESIAPEGEADDDEDAPGPPPFAVSGNAGGLLLVWFDAEGPHTASSREEIPEAQRGQVRVDSLALAPEERLDPAWVWVADLRAPGAGGRYTVRTMRREAFDALSDRASGVAAAQAQAEAQAAQAEAAAQAAAGAAPSVAAGGQSDVIIYGASWCGACRSAAAHLRSRGVPFVERDIEREPGARDEMQRKAMAAGVRPTGIPVIDVRGRILTGFDPAALDRLLARPI
jgi:glutaredoxin